MPVAQKPIQTNEASGLSGLAREKYWSEITVEEKYKFSLHSQRLPELPDGYRFGDSNKRAAARAVTPPKFAQAFYKANR